LFAASFSLPKFWVFGEYCMSFYIAQLAGGLSTITALLCVQAKEATILLLGQFMSNILSAVCYGLLGSLSGAWVCVLAAVQTLLISRLNKMEPAQRRNGVRITSVIFSAAFILGTVWTYSNWPDVISCICALLFVITISQEKAGQMRTVMIFSMSLWLVFDLAVGAYTSLLTHGATLASLLIARFRLDRKKCNESVGTEIIKREVG